MGTQCPLTLIKCVHLTASHLSSQLPSLQPGLFVPQEMLYSIVNTVLFFIWFWFPFQSNTGAILNFPSSRLTKPTLPTMPGLLWGWYCCCERYHTRTTLHSQLVSLPLTLQTDHLVNSRLDSTLRELCFSLTHALAPFQLHLWSHTYSGLVLQEFDSLEVLVPVSPQSPTKECNILTKEQWYGVLEYWENGKEWASRSMISQILLMRSSEECSSVGINELLVQPQVTSLRSQRVVNYADFWVLGARSNWWWFPYQRNYHSD